MKDGMNETDVLSVLLDDPQRGKQIGVCTTVNIKSKQKKERRT